MSFEEMKQEAAGSGAAVAAATGSGVSAAGGPVPAVPADSPRKHLWGEDAPKDSAFAQFLDNVYGVLFSPRATFEDLAARPPLGMALILYALVLAVVGIANLPALNESLTELGFERYLSSLTGLLTPFYIVFTVLSWIIGTAVLHLVAEWMGGQGRAADFFALGAFYRVPQLFLAPLALLAALSVPGLMNFFSLVLAIWSIVLQVYAIRANYRLSTGRAIAVLMVPAATAIALVIGLVISAVALSVPFLPPDMLGSLG